MFDMLTGQYKNLASKGRYGDTMLAHINPEEAALLKSMGGAGTVNPQTGLPEFYAGLPQFANLVPFPLAAEPSLGQALSPEAAQAAAQDLPKITVPAYSIGGYGAMSPASQQIAPEYKQYADLAPSAGMGAAQQTLGYTVPTTQTLQGQPLVAKYDAQGNFKYLTMEGNNFLTPDPSQPNIIAQPTINAKGELINYGVFDVTADRGTGFGDFLGGFVSDFSPMIAAAIGASLLGPAAPAAVGSGALSPYAAQAAGAYGGSSAAAAAAAAGNLAGIAEAAAAQNAVNLGIPTGGGIPTPPTGSGSPMAGIPTPPVVEPPPVIPTGSGSPMAGVTPSAVTSAVTSAVPSAVTPAVTNAAAAATAALPDLSSLGSAGSAILKFAKDNPSIAGSLLGAVTSAIGSANAPTSQTATTSIDPQMKAEYLANLERAKTTAAGLEARQIAQPSQLYTDAESKLYNLGMTPFGEADIAKFFNPFQEQVVQGALGDIERTRLMQEQSNRDLATRAKAFGGSRQGVVTGMTNEAALRQAATTGAQLRSAGYTQAANLGLAARPMDMAGLQTSLGLGTTRTALEQARLDALRNLGTERLGITSGALGLQPANVGQTSSQPLYNNTAGSLLSGGLTGAYIGSLLQPKTT
jgi:hypothetical protein